MFTAFRSDDGEEIIQVVTTLMWLEYVNAMHEATSGYMLQETASTSMYLQM